MGQHQVDKHMNCGGPRRKKRKREGREREREKNTWINNG